MYVKLLIDIKITLYSIVPRGTTGGDGNWNSVITQPSPITDYRLLLKPFPIFRKYVLSQHLSHFTVKTPWYLSKKLSSKLVRDFNKICTYLFKNTHPGGPRVGQFCIT
jgi:hypothetical protein